MSEIPNMDELSAPVDMGDVKKTIQDSQLPRGWYRTVPKVQFTVFKDEASGRVKTIFNPNVQSAEKKGRVSFAISHQTVINEKNGKPDSPSQLYAQAVEAYKKAYDAEPATVADVVNYVASFPLDLNVARGTTSEFVTQIRVPKE